MESTEQQLRKRKGAAWTQTWREGLQDESGHCLVLAFVHHVPKSGLRTPFLEVRFIEERGGKVRGCLVLEPSVNC